VALFTLLQFHRSQFGIKFGLNLPLAWDGYLVRGGLSQSDCPHCVSDAEPRYRYESYGACFYDSNRLSLVSLNGFEGIVTVEVLNLPADVTSEMPGSVFVPQDGVGSTSFALRATTDASLQDATVTLRGTSGAIDHTLEAPITVVELLPPCLNGLQISVQGGNPVAWDISVGGPVAEDTIVTLTSSHPTAAWVSKDSVTIPAGSSEVPVTVNTGPVNKTTDVTITASVAGFSHDKVLRVNP
jgi:hypothetical protein